VASTYSLLLDGSPADDAISTAISSIEVEENADLPGALLLKLAVSRTADGDLDWPGDSRLDPFVNVAVVATPEGGSRQCIFDGYILSQRLHLETGITSSTLEVWAQDASWLMNLEEKVREWVDVTDADVASSIFANYGITPADANDDDDSPSHTEDGHSLMQRATDIRFLQMLARRDGRLCRVACTDTPGDRIGYFAKPDLSADPVATLQPNDPVAPSVGAVDIDWDVTRPTSVGASQATFDDDDPSGVSGDVDDSGLSALDARALPDFTGKTMTVLLTTPVDSAGELTVRARSLLRESEWFVRCEGDADVSRLHAVLRVGQIVEINGIGTLHSGKYLVWSVRHTISSAAHRMRFRLVRNAVGPASVSGPAGLLGGLP
jgi:phage protein D